MIQNNSKESKVHCAFCCGLRPYDERTAKNPTSGKDFIAALDKLIAYIGCADLKMSEEEITREELKKYPTKVHEVI